MTVKKNAKPSIIRSRLLWIILLLVSMPVSAHYYGMSNIWGKKRTLCYRLQPSVAEDPNWPGWIHKAIDNWNDKSRQTG